MKIPTNKIEAAAATEASRYTLQAVKLDVQQKRLMATDGHILAVIPAEVSADDHSGLISLETFKNIRGMEKRCKLAVEVKLNGKVTAESPTGERLEHEYATGTFPNVDMVIPKFDGPATISFDVKLLLRLAEALKSEPMGKHEPGFVSLWIKDVNSPILVKSTKSEDKGAIGVLMPCRP